MNLYRIEFTKEDCTKGCSHVVALCFRDAAMYIAQVGGDRITGLALVEKGLPIVNSRGTMVYAKVTELLSDA